MPSLLYFIESPTAPKTPAELAAWGLGHAFDKPPVSRPNNQTGPGGQAGVCLCASPDRIGFFPDQQRWLRFPTSPNPKIPNQQITWCGLWTDSPPTPDDLRTAHPLRGSLVRLFDDQCWEVPIAVACDDESGAAMAIPRTLSVDNEGQWISGPVKPRYEPLWAAAKSFWDAIHGQVPDDQNELKLPIASVYDQAIAVLATNYRLTKTEVGLLGLLDDRGLIAQDILSAAVELHTYTRWLKKNQDTPTSATSPTDTGAAG